MRPLLRGLNERGITYRGVLYAGLMLTADGPQVIEFNARFGDPETQVIVPLLKTDLLEIMWAVTDDRLADVEVAWKDENAVCVVLAAAGYPDSPRKGDPIEFGDLAKKPATETSENQHLLFHAGTARHAGQLLTAGGRVLSAVGIGKGFPAARANAYQLAESVSFAGKHIRTDIGANL